MFPNRRVSKVRNLSEFEVGFIISAIDFDGSITISEKIRKQQYVWKQKTRNKKNYKSYCPMIMVSNTKKDILIKIKEMIGIGYITPNRKKAKPNRKICWRYSIENLADIKNLLIQIKDRLIVKKPQGEILFEYCCIRLRKLALNSKRIDLARYGEEEKELVRRIRELNLRSCGRQS